MTCLFLSLFLHSPRYAVSPTRPNRRFMVSSKPAPPAAAAGAASSVSAHKTEKKKAPKAKRALLPSVRALPDQAHLWTEKYAPSTEADLALFRKRVTEFRVRAFCHCVCECECV